MDVIAGYLILYLTIGMVGLMYAIKFNKRTGKTLLEIDGSWTSGPLLTIIAVIVVCWLPLVSFMAYEVTMHRIQAWRLNLRNRNRKIGRQMSMAFKKTMARLSSSK